MGLVEVTTLPASSTATQSEADGHEMPISTFGESIAAGADHINGESASASAVKITATHAPPATTATTNRDRRAAAPIFSSPIHGPVRSRAHSNPREEAAPPPGSV